MKKTIMTVLIGLFAVPVIFAGTTKFDSNLEVTGNLQITAGIINMVDVFVAPAAKSATKHASIDISTTNIVGSTVTTSVTQNITPRNIQVVAEFDNYNATATISATLAIVGTNARGVSDTETISFSTTTGTGNKAWSDIDSLTISASTYTVVTSSATKVTYKVGTYDTLGLSNSLNAVDDVIKLRTGTATEDASVSNVSTTYNTYTPNNAPDGSKNYAVRYKVIGR